MRRNNLVVGLRQRSEPIVSALADETDGAPSKAQLLED